MDFGRHLALGAVEADSERRWVIHLEAGLLARADTCTFNTHTAQGLEGGGDVRMCVWRGGGAESAAVQLLCDLT